MCVSSHFLWLSCSKIRRVVSQLSCKSKQPESCQELEKAFSSEAAEQMRLENRPDSIVCIGIINALYEVLIVEHTHLLKHITAAMLRAEQPGGLDDGLDNVKKDQEELHDLIRNGSETAKSLRALALLSGSFKLTKQFAAYIGTFLMDTVMHPCTQSLQIQTLSFVVHKETNARHHHGTPCRNMASWL